MAVERARTQLFLPDLDLAAPFSGESLLLVTYYAFWAVPAVAVAAWAARFVQPSPSRLSAAERAAGAGLLAMAILANMSFLRANLAERFGDAAVPIVLLAAWTAGTAAAWTSPVARGWVTLVPALLLIQIFVAAYAFSDVRRELDTSGLVRFIRQDRAALRRRARRTARSPAGSVAGDRPRQECWLLPPMSPSAPVPTIAFS